MAISDSMTFIHFRLIFSIQAIYSIFFIFASNNHTKHFRICVTELDQKQNDSSMIVHLCHCMFVTANTFIAHTSFVSRRQNVNLTEEISTHTKRYNPLGAGTEATQILLLLEKMAHIYNAI